MSRNNNSRRFYAIQWTYGRATNSRTGKRIGGYHSFDSLADRQAWIDDAQTAYTTQGGYRETIASSDAELRAIIRADAKAPQWDSGSRLLFHQGAYKVTRNLGEDEHLTYLKSQA